MSKKTSMDDIARKAGVSKYTVYISLRGEKGVSEETRKRVKEIADELGYVYDYGITKNGEPNTIFIIINKRELLYDKSLAEIFYAIQTKCAQENIRYIIFFYDEGMLCNEIPDCIKDGVAKGVVIMGEITEEYYEILENSNIPIVMLETYLETIYGNKVLVDNVKAGYDATIYLINKGHEKIVFYFDDERTAYVERWLGYLQAIKGANLKPLHTAKRDKIEDSLQKGQCSAIVFGSTENLLEVEQRLNKLGISIPDDMSAIVFDDCNTSGIEDRYNLTRVTIPRVKLGLSAFQALIYKIENPGSGVYKILIPAAIKEGQTVKNLDQPKGDDIASYD